MEKDTRDKLIDAGEKLFAEKGLSGVSIRELATEAGTNSALISYHFGGKEGLYAAIIEKQFSPIRMLLNSVEVIKVSPSERIIRYAQGVAIVHSKAPFLTKFIMREILNHPSPFLELFIQKYIQRIFKFLTTTLREGIEYGEFREDMDINAAALALVGMMNFYFIARPIARQFVPDTNTYGEQFVRQAVTIFLNGVKKHGNE